MKNMSNQKRLDGYGNSFKHMSIENVTDMLTFYFIDCSMFNSLFSITSQIKLLTNMLHIIKILSY
jgi:hypothetical protein